MAAGAIATVADLPEAKALGLFTTREDRRETVIIIRA